MFLIDRIGFLALLGLFAQAGMTWLLVGIFAAFLSDRRRPRLIRTWTAAFAVLGIGLTILSIRFFQSFELDVNAPREWEEGQPIVRFSNAIYMLSKIGFAYLLVRGTYGLADRSMPRAWNRIAAILAATGCGLGWVIPSITILLAIQAPVMMIANVLAWRCLRAYEPFHSTGIRLVRASLLVTAIIWSIHFIAAVGSQVAPWIVWSTMLAFNSHVDAGCELLLGAGIIIAALQEAQNQLRQSQEEQAKLRAEAARNEKLQALGALVSGVAHELNNPLTAILGFADGLADPQDLPRSSQIVREQAERCRGIVRSLSALAGQCAHERERVEPRELIERVIRGFEPQLRDRGVALVTELRDTPTLLADRFGIEQVLVNLIANAIQASPRGTSILVSLKHEDSGINIEVLDHGPGVPETIRNRLFEPFFTTKPPGEGTGLGLAVAHAIVRSHFGRLSVDDTPGGGARFRLWLPAEHATPNVVAEQTVETPTLAKLQLLIVDDEPTVRAAVRRYVQKFGWQVEEAPSAERALAMLKQHRFDVVLCDLRMPGLGGAGLYQQLRLEGSPLADRCLFMTGEMASPESVAMHTERPHACIEKPFVLAELARRIESVATNAECAPRRDEVRTPA